MATKYQLFTRQQVADRLQIKLNTLEKLAVTGGGPKFIKIRGRVLYRESDIIASTLYKRRMKRKSLPNQPPKLRVEAQP